MTKSPQLSSKLRLVITATFFGNTLQWFDYSLFGMLLPLLTGIFLPGMNYWVFFILLTFGSFARLVGGITFGRLGDTSGRKKALIRTILLMTFPVLFIGILPAYAKIGIASGIFLGAIYLFQGFCVGGEFPGSIVFLMESAPEKERSTIGIWSYIGVVFGMAFVSLNIAVMQQFLTPDELKLWGWRLPFFMGAVIGVIGIYMRHLLRETPIFQEAQKNGILTHTPVLTTFREYKNFLIQGIGFYILDVTCFKLIVIFSNYYLTTHLQIPLNDVLRINCVSVVLLLILLPAMGKLGSRLGNIRLAKWGAWGLLLFSMPLYLMMGLKSLPLIYFSQALLTFLMASYACNMPALLFAQFPTSVRYTAIGLTINFTVALFGGTALLLANWLILYTQSAAIPAFFLMGAALIALPTLRRLQKNLS